MTRKLNLALLALLIFVGAPVYWLMLDATTGDVVAKPVTIGELRRLAISARGEAPTEVRYETIGRRPTIGNMLAAGSGLRPASMMIRAYQIVLPDGATIAVDRGMRREVARNAGIESFKADAAARVDQAVAAARMALLLAPDVRHSGGRTVPAQDGSGRPRSHAITAKTGPYAVANGVVVIPTYGIAPGERMIYVQLADGREMLLAGDVAPTTHSWTELRPPARIATEHLVNRDRDEIVSWLLTVRALKQQAPELQIVSGHDGNIPGILAQRFVPPLVPNGDARR